MTPRRGFFDETFDLLETVFLVRHFAAAKFQGDLHLHIFAEEFDGVMHFDAEIMRINAGAELDFFDFRGVLALFGFLFLLRLLVTKLAEVHQPADRRIRRGCNLNQVNAVAAGLVQRVLQRENAKLCAVNADDAHFAGTDFPVYLNKRATRR